MRLPGFTAAKICLACGLALSLIPLTVPLPNAGEPFLTAHAERAEEFEWNFDLDWDWPELDFLKKKPLPEFIAVNQPTEKTGEIEFESATTVAVLPKQSSVVEDNIPKRVASLPLTEGPTDSPFFSEPLEVDNPAKPGGKSAPTPSAPLRRLAALGEPSVPLSASNEPAPRVKVDPLREYFPEDPFFDDPQPVKRDPVVELRALPPYPEPGPEQISETSQLTEELKSLRREVERLAQSQRRELTSPPKDRLAQGINLDQAFEILQSINSAKQERDAKLNEMLGRTPPATPGAPNTANNPTPAAPQNSSFAPTAPANEAPRQRRVPVIRMQPAKQGDTERFDLQVDDADIVQVLEMLADLSGWNIVTEPGLTGTCTLNLKDVTAEEVLEAVLRPRGLVARQQGQVIYVYAADKELAARHVITKVYRPHYISANDLQALIVPLLTAGVGKISITNPADAGIPLDNQSAGGNSLSQQDAILVQDYEEVIAEVDGVLLEMDVPPPQVVIEAVILRVRLDDTTKFGVNLALLGGNDNQLVSFGNGAIINSTPGYPGGDNTSLIPAMGEFVAATAGLKYGFVRGDVSGFIDALESIAETSLVASPQLRVLNKQKAELIIGQRLGFRTRTFNGQQTIENVEFIDVGTKLILRPYIAPDGIVRMEIHPERSSGQIDDDGIPQVETTEVTSAVMVANGTTVVIGGLIDESVEENVQQVPVLGSVPWVGNAFKNKTEKMVRNELIVLITPRIVQDSSEAVRGEVLKYESEMRAQHFADQLAPVSRRNLARMHLERAEELYARGELIQARDHAVHALKIRKNFGEALTLLNQIEASMGTQVRHILGRPPLSDPPLLLEPDGSLTEYPPMDEGSEVFVPTPAPPLEEPGPELKTSQLPKLSLPKLPELKSGRGKESDR
ncbi:hypothetical protein [Calycomorphotria hydatis]|uniref:Type IV pilus biogenesis and competence protein PilQ n=1 Tax=Calycomorphotria hydatis TaxID=2528027 RepID=A0A517TF23_9PLAN|nr:hypothetical protein [Calycomorphotria hydatis]QDT66969.1 Type IV pilus biogenesis and competence protein PilQ precursor [Calycomorphotria hydatis]